MPHPSILRVLNMTPAQWGALPPDVGPEARPDRGELKKKAYRLLEEEKKQGESSIAGRLDRLELMVRNISNAYQDERSPEALNQLARRVEDIEVALGELRSSENKLIARVATLEKGMPEDAHDKDKKKH